MDLSLCHVYGGDRARGVRHMSQLRISLIAPSGSGKSTVAGLMKNAFERSGRTVEILKLATPLYQLQTDVYSECGLTLKPDQQDQRLLEVIAAEMRRIAPDSLIRHFEQRLARTKSDVVLNDDLRDDKTDWPWMKQNGFIVVRVVAHAALRNSRLHNRGNVTLIENSPLNIQIERIQEDHALINEGTLDRLRTQVETLAALLLHRNASVTAR
jgi:hypothetical protein